MLSDLLFFVVTRGVAIFYTAVGGLATSEPGVRETKAQTEEAGTKSQFVFYGREMSRYVTST